MATPNGTKPLKGPAEKFDYLVSPLGGDMCETIKNRGEGADKKK